MASGGEASGDKAETWCQPTLEPPLRKIGDPTPTQRCREDHEGRQKRLLADTKPKIDAHIATFGMVLDSLEADHQAVADQVDFDLDGETRYAAAWQLSGRSIGLARGVVVLLREACCAEAMVLSRSLHECTRLLDALADSEDGNDLLLRWLADQDRAYVRPGDARRAESRADERHAAVMRASGWMPAGPTAPLSKILYDQFSRMAHHRRGAVEEAVNGATRTMVRGPSTDAHQWAEAVATGSQVIEETLLAIGAALSRFYGVEYLRERLKPLQTAIRAIRAEAQL